MVGSGSISATRPEKNLNRLLLVLALVFAIRRWVCTPALIVGTSMLPTLHPGQIALINKLAYFVRSPGRGDIVCIRTCTGLMVKRIIGLPGEVVSLRQGVLYVDGRRVAETYVVLPNHRELAPGKIPPNSYGVIGDNRSGTVVALVNDNRIVGKLIELDRR